MKSTAKIWMVIISLLSSYNGFSQIKNLADTSLHISGNCNMCKKTIESAGNLKQEAQVSWDKDSKVAIISYDKNKTNPDEILKRIAIAGYDSETFLAPDETYAKLPDCCLYERQFKPKTQQVKSTLNGHGHDHNNASVSHSETSMVASKPLGAIYRVYFTLKDALVNADVVLASANATKMLNNMEIILMDNLDDSTHTKWMQVGKDLSTSLKQIAQSKDLANQRKSFQKVSTFIYELLQVSNHETTVYYQHCPMYDQGKGGHWLSMESDIKNPYYGASMLTCGSNLGTIK